MTRIKPMASLVRLPLKIDQLSAGSKGSVLVVDFIDFSATRQLSQVLGERTEDNSVYCLDPVSDLAGDREYWPLDELADGYADLWRKNAPASPQLTIVGYCSAAALSCSIAARLAGPVAVQLLMVQPTWPDTQLVSTYYEEFRANLGGDPSPAPDLGAEPEDALRQMQRTLRGDLDLMAARAGVDATSPALAELLDRYRAWLGFMLASSAARSRPLPAHPRPTILVTADTEPSVPHAGLPAYDVIRHPVPADALMGETILADAVLACARQHANRDSCSSPGSLSRSTRLASS